MADKLIILVIRRDTICARLRKQGKHSLAEQVHSRWLIWLMSQRKREW